MVFYKNIGKLMLLCLPALAMAGCDRQEAISYSEDVRPILEQNCIACHTAGAQGEEASGFGMDTYEGLMKGTNLGPMIIAGDSASSNMVILMEGRADPSISMPHGEQETVAEAEIAKIKLWIDQGAKNN
jgi:mono/diheme cytochrome c family protein